jgi:hypothetical protein
MGTWGPGNFDGDDAVDYVSKVVGGFVETVEQLFAQGRASLDDQGEGRLMPTVEMIGLLCDWCQGGPPAIRVVAPPDPGWYGGEAAVLGDLRRGDRWAAAAGQEHFGPERRAHIVRTFDRLELLATDFWEERPVTSS